MFRKFITGFVTGTLVLSSALPMMAMTNMKVKGNGAKSKNSVTVFNSTKNKVTQSSLTLSTVRVTQVGNTGLNSASDNTGGDVKLTSGDVTNLTGVSVSGGSNVAEQTPCNLCDNGTDVVVKQNGVESNNVVIVADTNLTKTEQMTETVSSVCVSQVGNSGLNGTSDNTGGDVELKTGSVGNGVEVTVEGGSNVAGNGPVL